jgi:hypothetical protein
MENRGVRGSRGRAALALRAGRPKPQALLKPEARSPAWRDTVPDVSPSKGNDSMKRETTGVVSPGVLTERPGPAPTAATASC